MLHYCSDKCAIVCRADLGVAIYAIVTGLTMIGLGIHSLWRMYRT